MKDYSVHIIQNSSSARDALTKLEILPNLDSRTLFVVNVSFKLVGSITDGDIRRGLLSGLEISDSIQNFMRTNFKYINHKEDYFLKINEFKKLGISMIPFTDSELKIIRILDLSQIKTILPLTAVIMAGGRGERLRPYTDTIPKPMLLIGDKPILEHNIDRLIEFGINEIFICVQYLSEVIIEYFGDGSKKGISIKYIKEDAPMGTIGALGLMEDFNNNTILLLNSDILTNIDYEDFYKYYLENESPFCIATIPYQVNIPYAVLQLESKKVKAFVEKPTYTYYSNGGIYLLSSDLLQFIFGKTYFNATDLIEKLILENQNVVHYPLLNYWLDIGKPEDFIKAKEDVKHIQF